MHLESVFKSSLEWSWGAQITGHGRVRYMRSCERVCCCSESGSAQISSDNGEREGVEVLATSRVGLDEEIDCPQQRAVATAHVNNEPRLSRHGLGVEDGPDVNADEIVEVTAVHEARAEDVEPPVDPHLVLTPALKHRRCLTKRRLAQPLEQRTVRHAHSKGSAALQYEAAGVAQRYPLSARVIRAPSPCRKKRADARRGLSRHRLKAHGKQGGCKQWRIVRMVARGVATEHMPSAIAVYNCFIGLHQAQPQQQGSQHRPREHLGKER